MLNCNAGKILSKSGRKLSHLDQLIAGSFPHSDCLVIEPTSILREERDEERRKIKRLLPVHCSGSSAHLRPQVLTDGGDVKRTNQNTIHYSKIVTFQATKHSRSQTFDPFGQRRGPKS